MHIKDTILGLLIYFAMGLYLLAFIATLVRLRKIGKLLFMIGFVAALGAWIFRWYLVRHIPLQNLFEVFLFLGLAVYPLSIFCLRALRTGGFAADMLIGAIVLFPAGFIFSEVPMHLPPALQSWLFVPHVLVYMLSYILMTKAAFQAFLQLDNYKNNPAANLIDNEEATYRLVCAGFPLMTAGLVLGSIWAKLAWGDWWGWDPKELWSLAGWLVFASYFHFRSLFGKKFSRINSLWAIAGFVIIVITLLWANLSRLFAGLHAYA